MKTAVIYYSHDGNCALIAEMITAALGAEELRLRCAREIPSRGFGKFFQGGGQVFSGAKPELLPYTFESDPWDLIVIGTPVWAGGFAPALAAFIDDSGIRGKKLALFCCHGGGKGRVFDKLKAALPGNTFTETIDFVTPLKNGADAAREKLGPWLQGLGK